MQNFIICSYYTLDTPYQQVAHDYLMPSVHKFNLESDIRGILSLGSWQANTSYKSQFILWMLEHHKKNVVFLDSDAVVHLYPQLFHEIPEEFNIAAHILDRSAWYGSVRNPQYELLSGTAFFRYSLETLRIVEKWIEKCKENPRIWEQQLLQRVLEEANTKIFELPLSYCYIASLPDGSSPLVKCEDPVIVHHQKSRELRNTIR